MRFALPVTLHADHSNIRGSSRRAFRLSLMRDADITLGLINLAIIPHGVSKVSQYCTRYFVAEPLLEAAVHGLVVRVALRKHVSLRARVENYSTASRTLRAGTGCGKAPLTATSRSPSAARTRYVNFLTLTLEARGYVCPRHTASSVSLIRK